MGLLPESAYIGVWTNHNKGPILGSTLTVPSSTGTILIAILALIVGWTGSHLFDLVCFAIYQLRSSSNSQDGLYHQQQALLRSRLSDTTLLYRFLKVGFAWRSHTRAPLSRTLPFSLVALVNIVFFVVAGVFSSKVTSIDSEVIGRGKCGMLAGLTTLKPFPDWTPQDWLTGDVIFTAAYITFRKESAYARSCYGNYIETEDEQCTVFTTPLIASRKDVRAACPFPEDICSGSAVEFDTGRMNSDKHFGMNSKPENQIGMRKVMTCAPFPLEDFSTPWTLEQKPALEAYMPLIVPNDTYKYYYLGTSLGYGTSLSDYTWVLSNISLSLHTQPYDLQSLSFYPRNLENSINQTMATESGFLPIAELNRTDADVTLLLLNKKVGYTGQVNDPWFTATVQRTSGVGIPEVWFSNESYSGIGCTEQYQFCNGDTCTALDGLFTYSFQKPPEIGYNAAQAATYNLLIQFANYMRIDNVYKFLQNEILLANQVVYGSFGISTPLEDSHWITEMENLHNISLAGLQYCPVSYAAPGNVPIRDGFNLHDFIVPETDPEKLNLCNNQRFRSPKYSSFSILGLAIIVAMSLVIILLNLSLQRVVGWVQTRRGRGWKRLEWIEDDVLQLQRMAFEGRWEGPWKGKTDEVPVTQRFGAELRRGRGGRDGEYRLLDLSQNQSLEPLDREQSLDSISYTNR